MRLGVDECGLILLDWKSDATRTWLAKPGSGGEKSENTSGMKPPNGSRWSLFEVIMLRCFYGCKSRAASSIDRSLCYSVIES